MKTKQTAGARLRSGKIQDPKNLFVWVGYDCLDIVESQIRVRSGYRSGHSAFTIDRARKTRTLNDGILRHRAKMLADFLGLPLVEDRQRLKHNCCQCACHLTGF